MLGFQPLEKDQEQLDFKARTFTRSCVEEMSVDCCPSRSRSPLKGGRLQDSLSLSPSLPGPATPPAVPGEYLTYRSPLAQRYQYGAKSMAFNFSDFKKIHTWRLLWTYLARAHKVRSHLRAKDRSVSFWKSTGCCRKSACKKRDRALFPFRCRDGEIVCAYPYVEHTKKPLLKSN